MASNKEHCAFMDSTPLLTRQVLLVGLLGALLVLTYVVMQPFIVPVVWATILAYTTWPFYRKVRGLLRGRATASALLMTVVLACALVLPLYWLAALVQDELTAAYQAVATYLAQGPQPLPDAIRSIPWAGEQLQGLLDQLATQTGTFNEHLTRWFQRSGGDLVGLLGGVGRNIVKLIFALITLFFFYRDGETLRRQMGRLLLRFFGDRIDPYVRAGARMTRAVVYGILITALIQGAIAGIGYALVGVRAPVLLGALTAIVSLAPLVGTSLVWGPICIWLLMSNHPWPAVILLAWGVVLVHPIDNVIRPLVISNVTRIPFLLVMFGVLGGLAAFGLIGLFLGPVILALGFAVWREWLGEAVATDEPF
jgi:predicted PurR-regulated permease PerM